MTNEKGSYHVSRNSCDCHPETCNCPDHVVCGPDGERVLGIHNPLAAETVASLLNAAAGLPQSGTVDLGARYGSGDFTLGRNTHNYCHPETCCCDDYAIFGPNGTKFLPLNDYELGEEIVAIINKSRAQGVKPS